MDGVSSSVSIRHAWDSYTKRVLISELSLFQSLFCTLLGAAGTQDTVLTIEAFRGVLIEGFYCISY